MIKLTSQGYHYIRSVRHFGQKFEKIKMGTYPKVILGELLLLADNYPEALPEYEDEADLLSSILESVQDTTGTPLDEEDYEGLRNAIKSLLQAGYITKT